jgi:UDP-N-acetylglucosamine--N-acetylmuramyl-(pentapeptide) pyrophosphoryl-undecaprenol N-acetylglucosamine transferase
VRESLLGGDPIKAKTVLGIKTEKPILLILGGSQGAKKINDVVGQILIRLVETYEIVHQCGEKNFDESKDLAGKAGIKINRDNYHLYPFMRDDKEELKSALACADLVLSRAGASSIAEIAAYGKPSILVPLHGSANDHQIHNAFEVAKAGAAIALREENLTPELLLGKIDILMNDLPLRKMMGDKAKLFYHTESAATIADIVLRLGNKEKLKD